MRRMVLGALLLAAAQVHASQAQVHSVEGVGDLFSGDLIGAQLLPSGVVAPGPGTKALADGLSGPVLALVRAGDGALYAATAAPGRVHKIVDGKPAEVVLEVDKPLITALLPIGKATLVALTSPDGGAEIIDLPSKRHEHVIAKDVKLLLSGAVVDDIVYAVGGGDEGVLLRLDPKAKKWDRIVTVDEPQLRSIAIQKRGANTRIVVGGGEEGIVYEVLGQGSAWTARALLDAAPGEVTSIALAADGTVFASAVDSEAKLSKGATAKAKADDDDDDAKKKKQKARKVKSAEIWRIDAKGHASILWQSKEQGAYALAITSREELLAGTGPKGRVLKLDPAGGRPAGVLVRARDHDEVTAIVAEKAGLFFGTAHGAAVLTTTAAGTGIYESPALDADALARYGRMSARGKGTPRLSLRTGNTKEPDATWSAWVTDASAAPAAQYAQIKAELSTGTELQALFLSYLVDNRAPEVDRVEVLAAGWKVVSSQREPSETRSVTFNEKPFAKFLDRKGGQNPTLDERPYGKQSFDTGWRTIYAYVEDADKDALRYRFFIGRAAADGSVASWEMWKDWSEEPFLSFEASRLADGDYRVWVDVDDLLTNGPARSLGDTDISPVFTVSHTPPRIENAKAARSKDRVKVSLDVSAALPLTVVRCSTGADDWVPIDPKDGVTDASRESFEVDMAAPKKLGAVSCEAYDEALNFARVDVSVR